jgi:hypothetical protein
MRCVAARLLPAATSRCFTTLGACARTAGRLERCVSPVETARLEIVCALVVPGVQIPPSPFIESPDNDMKAERPARTVRSTSGAPGEVTEWSKVHAWRACVGFTPYRGFESLPLRCAGVGCVPSRSVDTVRRRAAGRWWLGPAQDGVANPVRSGRKQRYRMSLCAAGSPSHHCRAAHRPVDTRP